MTLDNLQYSFSKSICIFVGYDIVFLSQFDGPIATEKQQGQWILIFMDIPN